MDKKAILVIISSILLIFLVFYYGVENNKPAIIEGGTEGKINTEIKDAKGAEFN